MTREQALAEAERIRRAVRDLGAEDAEALIADALMAAAGCAPSPGGPPHA